MPLQAPNLDTRSFEDIFREARLRIPRYTPEWTDFNESDPGITLLQLYAWLTESILFQLNRVPERNYRKFLKLLGLELRPAQPATAHLTFTARPGGTVGPVPAGTRIGAQPAAGGEQVIFETEESLFPVAVPLSTVLVFDGAAFVEVTAANQAAGTTFRPLGWVPQVGSALYLGFEPPNPLPIGRLFPQEIRLRAFLPRADLLTGAQSCRTPAPAPPVSLQWEYKPTDAARAWRRLNTFEDESQAFTRDGNLSIEGPSEIEPTTVWRIEPRYWLRCRLVAGSYPAGRAPEIDLLRANTVPAVSLSTVRDEILGNSEGLPAQSFELRHRPVVPDTLRLEVSGTDTEAEQWARVDDFLASDGDDPHYVLNATAGTIVLGDGRNGRIPPAGLQLVAREYRWGGGDSANVTSGSISTPLTALQGIDRVENLRPAVGGRDEQTVEELKKTAPSVLRHRNRAISADDFAVLAAEAGGVLRATALALAHPDHPGVEVPGAVTVVVVPDSDDVPPTPSRALLGHVCRFLEGHRLLTTELYVRGPEYLPVKVAARLGARPSAAFDAVARSAGVALDRFLDPKRWEFGRDLYPTALYDVLLDVAGVEAVESLELEVSGRPHDRLARPVVVPAGGLVYGLDHAIVVTPAVDR